jgi:hypothetical protein
MRDDSSAMSTTSDSGSLLFVHENHVAFDLDAEIAASIEPVQKQHP